MTNLWFVNEDYPAACKSKICGQWPGRECIFTANASICSAKNARNDVYAVISDLSLILPILCQFSVSAKLTVGLPFPQESHEAPSLSRFPLNLAKIGSFYIYFDLAAVLPSFFSASSRRLWMRSSG